MGWRSTNDLAQVEDDTIGIIGPVNMVVGWLTVLMLTTSKHLVDSRDASPDKMNTVLTVLRGCQKDTKNSTILLLYYVVVILFSLLFSYTNFIGRTAW